MNTRVRRKPLGERSEPHPNALSVIQHVQAYLFGAQNEEALEAWILAVGTGLGRGLALDAILLQMCTRWNAAAQGELLTFRPGTRLSWTLTALGAKGWAEYVTNHYKITTAGRAVLAMPSTVGRAGEAAAAQFPQDASGPTVAPAPAKVAEGAPSSSAGDAKTREESTP